MVRKVLGGLALVLALASCSPTTAPDSGPLGGPRTGPVPTPAVGAEAPVDTDTSSAPNGIVCSFPDNAEAQAAAERIIALGPRPPDPADTSIAWAIHDDLTEVTCSYQGSAGFNSASVIKVATVATWLWQVEQGRLDFYEDQAYLAEAAITISDNDAQELLWLTIGGAEGMAEFLGVAGMTQTVPSFIDGDWGLTNITADDQLTLVRHLNDATLLTREHSDYLLTLMHSVDAEQFWGVSSGAPAEAWIALKNGWLDDPVAEPMGVPAEDPGGDAAEGSEGSDPQPTEEPSWDEWGGEVTWTNNSIGQVRAPLASYALVVLSNGNPTDEDGRTRVDEVAAALARTVQNG